MVILLGGVVKAVDVTTLSDYKKCLKLSNQILTFGGLPYTPTEYIKGDGNQYIDTEYYVSPDTKIELDIKFEGTYRGLITGGSNNILSARTSSDAFQINFGGSATESTRIFNWTYRPYQYGGSQDVWLLDVTESIVKNRNTFSRYNNKVTYSTKSSVTQYRSSTSTKSLYLLGNNSDGEEHLPFKAYPYTYLYGVKFYENGSLTKDMIPVIDKDNIPCMFDRMEKKYYYSIGSQPFIAGPIPEEYKFTRLEYIESTGTQYIDLGIKDTGKLNIEIKATNTNFANSGALFGYYSGGSGTSAGILDFNCFHSGDR